MVKKTVIYLTTLLLILTALSSGLPQMTATENSSEIMIFPLRFEQPRFHHINLDNQFIDLIRLNDTKLFRSTGKPVLPVKPITILLPYQTTLDDIHLEVKKSRPFYSLLNHLELSPRSRSFDESIISTIQTITPTFNQESYYPENIIENMGIQTMHGCSLLYLNIYPVQILQTQNLIKSYQDIELEITVTETQNPHDQILTMDQRQSLATMVINTETLATYPNQYPTFTEDSSVIDYLIVTTEDLRNLSDPQEYTFDDLITQRESQGLSCDIITIETIQTIYPGVDTQEKIRNCIKDYYQSHQTQWVLLGGDNEYVPARYLVSIDGLEQNEDEITSDLYYQCLDGNYNYDNDDEWGEQYDGENGNRIDLLAEVYLGRAPVDDATDISAFVEKTLIYEQQSWDDPWTHRVLSAGEQLWDGNGGYGAGYVELCIDFQTIYDHETYGIPSDLYNIVELYERDMSWDDQDVIDEIDQGVSIINHVGHGNPAKAMKLSHFELTDLNNTGRYGLFYSQACHSGQFEYFDDCFAERWVNIPKKGGFAAIMNTGYGYGSIRDYDGPDNRYAREFYDALFSPHEKISTIGKAHQDAKEDNIWRLSDNNMYHIYYCKTLFGDPYVSIIGSESVSAEFSWTPDYPVTGGIISFKDESKGMITFRQWDLGDGQLTQEKNPIHVYSSDGIYTVSLTVQDQFGYLSSVSHQVEVKDYWNPRPIISPDYYNGGNFTIDFSAEQSYDPDGTIVSYYWDFDDGTHADDETVTHTFPGEGTYLVELIVTDDEGNIAKNTSKIILLYQLPPDTPSVNQAPSLVSSGETFEVIVQTDDPESDQVQYGIKWDQDSSVEWDSNWYESGQTGVFSHTYTTLGPHQISVKARDVHYAESNWSKPILITVEDEHDPTLNLLSPVNGIYINDLHRLPFFVPVIFGPVTIQVNASDESGIDKVLFFVDDSIHPKAEALSPPYRFVLDDPLFFKHDLIIKVYDNAGRITEEQVSFWKFM